MTEQDPTRAEVVVEQLEKDASRFARIREWLTRGNASDAMVRMSFANDVWHMEQETRKVLAALRSAEPSPAVEGDSAFERECFEAAAQRIRDKRTPERTEPVELEERAREILADVRGPSATRAHILAREDDKVIGIGFAVKAIIAALSTLPASNAGDVEHLQDKLRMIISHATGGASSDIDRSINDICVAITENRNFIYQAGIDHAHREAALATPRAGQGGEIVGARLFDMIFERFCEGDFEIEVNDIVTGLCVDAGLVEKVPFDPEHHTDDSGALEVGEDYYQLTEAGRQFRMLREKKPTAIRQSGQGGGS